MADSRAQIESRVRAFAAELETLIRQAALEAVGQALGAPPRRGPGRPPKSSYGASSAPRAPRSSASRSLGGGRGRRSAEQMENTINSLLNHIKAHPGQRMEQIAAALGTTSSRLNRPITKLLSSRNVKR